MVSSDREANLMGDNTQLESVAGGDGYEPIANLTNFYFNNETASTNMRSNLRHYSHLKTSRNYNKH